MILQVTPIVAISPLIIILVKDTRLALTVCAAIVALFPIISNTTLGLRSVDPGLVNLFRANKASRLQTLMRLRIPSALPYFFAGLRISSGLALIGAVVAEFVAGTGGMGSGLAYEILQAGFQLDIPLMFAVLTMDPPMSDGQWLLITLTCGTGGSLWAIGSAAGVALMGQARGVYSFSSHLKWTWAVALGYIAAIYTHLWINAALF